MDPRIKARLSQTEQEDPLNERVRAYLLERMSAAPETAPDYSRERQLDVIGNAGTNISNIFLNRAGLGPVKTGEGFEAAARRDAVRPKETRDELASDLYAAGVRNERAMLPEAAKQARFDTEQARLLAKENQRSTETGARIKNETDRVQALKDALKLKQDKARGLGRVAPKAPSDAIPFDAKVYKWDGQGNPKRITEAGKKVAEKAAQFGMSKAAIKQLKARLGEWANAPSIEAKAALAPAVLAASTSLNSALGQGAMAEQERRAAYGALGANVGDAEGLETLLTGIFRNNDAETARKMSARASGMESIIDAQMDAYAKSNGYAPEALTAQPGAMGPAAGGKVTVTNGKETLRIDASKVAEAEKDGFKVVK